MNYLIQKGADPHKLAIDIHTFGRLNKLKDPSKHELFAEYIQPTQYIPVALSLIAIFRRFILKNIF